MKRYDIRAYTINSDATWEYTESQDGDFCLFRDVEKLKTELDALKNDALTIWGVVGKVSQIHWNKEQREAERRILATTEEGK